MENDSTPTDGLPDLLRPGLAAVFCGTAAGATSAARQAYYAGRGNRFWKTLHATGITDRALDPSEWRLLEGYGIGLTDVAKSHAGMDRELPGNAFGPERLRLEIARCRPVLVAFNGKRAAREALGQAAGYGPAGISFEGAEAWVLPSTSGTANGSWNESFWRGFARRLEEVRTASPASGLPEAEEQ